MQTTASCERHHLTRRTVEPNLLQDSAIDDSRLLVVWDGSKFSAGGFDSFNVFLRLFVGNLTEDDVTAVKPGRNDGGDEELGAVRVRARVSHGEKERPVVLPGIRSVQVLVLELVAIDGLATSAILTSEIAAWLSPAQIERKFSAVLGTMS